MKINFKKNLIITIMFLFCLFSPALANKVQVIPVKGNIDGVIESLVKDGIDQAIVNDADLIIFDIDTYGGFISSAENIKDMMVKLKVPSVSFINTKAESAGVLLAIAGEKIAVSPTSTIGSAESIPNDPKTMSMWISLLRDTAQFRNRDDMLIKSMADENVEIEGVVGKGELTNLTSKEALKVNLADFEASSYKDIAEKMGLKDVEVIETQKSLKLKIAEFVTNPIVNTLLLVIAFVGAVVELFMPGFGLGGVISIIAFGLFFTGNMVTGNADWVSLLLFCLGAVLIVVEILLPGFGLPGIAGIVFLLIGLVTSMANVETGLVSLSVAVIISSLVGFFLVKHGLTSPIMKDVVLTKSIETGSDGENNSNMFSLMGKQGVTLTVLRPSGTAEIDGKRYDVLTEGEFIQKNADVEVLRVVGSKIFVRRI